MHRNKGSQAAARTMREVSYQADLAEIAMPCSWMLIADIGYWMLAGTHALSAHEKSGLLPFCPATDGVGSL